MKVYTGHPADRLGLVSPRWKRDAPGKPLRKVFTPDAHAEITRMFGVTIFGWFIGVQKYVAREHTNPDMVQDGRKA